MRQSDIAVTPSESAVLLKPTNGSPFIANADGSIGIRRECIPLLIEVLAAQLSGQQICSVGEQRHASAALRALRAYLGVPEEHVIAGRSWL